MNVDQSAVLNSLTHRVYVKDLTGRYAYVNQSFAETLGLDVHQIIGKTDFDFTPISQHQTIRDDESFVFSGRSLINVERYQKRFNAVTKIMLTLVPYYSPDGSICGALGSFFDCSNHLVVETTGRFVNQKLELGFVKESFSPTEIRICFYVLHNLTAERIAEKTGTAVSTVRYHIENIKNKMQCESKSEITERAIKTGIAWKIFSLQHHIEDLEA